LALLAQLVLYPNSVLVQNLCLRLVLQNRSLLVLRQILATVHQML
jgi:hypothetical protein